MPLALARSTPPRANIQRAGQKVSGDVISRPLGSPFNLRWEPCGPHTQSPRILPSTVLNGEYGALKGVPFSCSRGLKVTVRNARAGDGSLVYNEAPAEPERRTTADGPEKSLHHACHRDPKSPDRRNPPWLERSLTGAGAVRERPGCLNT
ncbi:hypothetical protein NITHO_3120015 [Nitrolancea hollandica Lb]|uniref:Uncharacterized protein n=1 Tax=Nitrolancea hollandica Lb TaxID=1129897 RepID=I4EHJ1_9BACT|nr:hypothetical protein NITHO_3120015 [Nitrolancea hollandica Lb]